MQEIPIEFLSSERSSSFSAHINLLLQEGDSLLRVSTAIQHEHGMTQSMVDKLVIDEMWEFLNAQITAKYAKVEMPTQIPLGQDALQPKSVIIGTNLFWDLSRKECH